MYEEYSTSSREFCWVRAVVVESPISYGDNLVGR